jgi:hypothetical protein
MKKCWVLFDRESDKAILGVFPNYESALQYKHKKAHEWVQRVLDTEDPYDLVGHAEITAEDKVYLFVDFLRTIEEELVPFFDAVDILEEEE